MVNAQTAHDTHDADRPIPPRYWWLKRILLAIGVLILALVALRLWWGHEAERRLQAKIDEYHAAGQPVTIEDFQFPPVPDEDNAAYFLMQAATALTRPSAADAGIEEIYSYPQALPDHADAVGRWIKTNGQALNLVREARLKDKVDWKIRFTSPVFSVLLPQLSPQRQLARFLNTAALYQQHVGDDAATVESLRDSVAQGDTLAGGQPFLISCLVAVAIDALTCYSVESVAPTLRIALSDSLADSDARPARPSQVHALIADLLDERPLRKGWRRAMYTERLCALDSVNVALTTPAGMMAITGGPNLPPPVIGKLLRPMFVLDAVFMMEHCTGVADASACASYPEALGIVQDYPAFESGIERNSHALSRLLLPSLGALVKQEFMAIALRRMAATSLAIRMFEVDQGQRPARLEDLVPDYLPAVPADPFADDGRTLGYLPDAEPPVLYSVGPDGVDDGGEYELTGATHVNVNAKDLVFFLNGDRPRSPPSSLATDPNAAQAVEDETEQVGDGRQPDQDQAADEQ